MVHLNSDDNKIHVPVEKSWLLGLAVAFMVQVFGGIWWAAVTSTKLGTIEAGLIGMQTQLNADTSDRALKAAAATRLEDRILRLEERDSELAGSIKDINAHLAAIESYMNTHSKVIGK